MLTILLAVLWCILALPSIAGAWLIGTIDVGRAWTQ